MLKVTVKLSKTVTSSDFPLLSKIVHSLLFSLLFLLIASLTVLCLSRQIPQICVALRQNHDSRCCIRRLDHSIVNAPRTVKKRNTHTFSWRSYLRCGRNKIRLLYVSLPYPEGEERKRISPRRCSCLSPSCPSSRSGTGAAAGSWKEACAGGSAGRPASCS